MYVVPAGIVLGDDVVEEKRQARKQAEMQAQQEQQAMAQGQAMAQAAPQIAGAAKSLSETQMPGGGNALEAMAGISDGVNLPA